jgi:hypothetical protein
MAVVRTALAMTLVAAAVGVPAAMRLTREQRAELIARSQIWMPSDVASKNLLLGPDGDGAFAPGETITCDYVDKKLDGNTPKFECRIAPDDEVKAKVGAGNGEVFAEVAATRLLWALGFGADRMYPVKVICRGCPASLGGILKADGTRLFDPASVERKFRGREIDTPVEGWSWTELASVREEAGGAPRYQRDGLLLLAAFIQHTDNKPAQQRLVCLDGRAKTDPDGRKASEAACKQPFMLINDLGMTFGRANWFNTNAPGSMNLDAWSKVPVWKDPARCVANLSRSYSGTLDNPQVSEAGRAFLAGLLSQLSDAQLGDLFTAARVELRTRIPDKARSGFATVDEWVDAFKNKRAQIVEHRCGQPDTTSARHRS